MNRKLITATVCMLLVLLAVVSATFIADALSSPDTYRVLVDEIDNEIETVRNLTAASALSSAVVSALPGDAATPISEKLADCSEYLLLVMCVLYAEKFLLTIIGAAVFRIIIPIALLMIIVSLFINPEILRHIAFKLIVLCLAVILVIPISIMISDKITATYQTSIDSTLSSCELFSDEASAVDEDASIWDKITGTATSLLDNASSILSSMLQTLAVMIVTSCVIPLLVLAFFLWIVKLITGIELPIHHIRHTHRYTGRVAKETNS